MVETLVARFVPPNSVDEQWDLQGLEQELAVEAGLPLPVTRWPVETEELDAEAISRRVQEAMTAHFDEKEAQLGPETMRSLEKHIMLTVLDKSWKEHLASMDYLRQGIHLRGYAQKQPTAEYKKEAFELFRTCWRRSSAKWSPSSPACASAARGSGRAGGRGTALAATAISSCSSGTRMRAVTAPMRKRRGRGRAARFSRSPVTAQGRPAMIPVPRQRKKFKHCHGQLS